MWLSPHVTSRSVLLAERLIARCDQAQYALEGPSSEALLEAAKGLFDALGREQGQVQVGKGDLEAEGQAFENRERQLRPQTREFRPSKTASPRSRLSN